MFARLRAAYVTARLDGIGILLIVAGYLALLGAAVVAVVPILGLAVALAAAGGVLLVSAGLFIWLPRRKAVSRHASQAPPRSAGEQGTEQASDDWVEQARTLAEKHPVEAAVVAAAVGGLLVASPKLRGLVRDSVTTAAAAKRLRDSHH